MISPESDSINPMIKRPVVDFPELESPTKTNFSPFFTLKEIELTALTKFFSFINCFLIGKYFCKFLISKRYSSDTAQSLLLHFLIIKKTSADRVIGFIKIRMFHLTFIHYMTASGSECASFRHIIKIWYSSFN